MSAVQPQQPSWQQRHLRWLYLLAAVPTLTDLVETGRWPTSPREYLTELVMTLFVLLAVTLLVRQSKQLARETDAYIRSKEQLQHANRLATVGQLAAGVAHELGSPLQVVAGRAKMIATGESEQGEARESAQIIGEQATRMTQIIRGLLDFARRRPPQRAATDLKSIAAEVHRMLGPIARRKAVSLDLAGDEAIAVDLDPVQIQQALTNLVMNAIQAVPHGGRVAIALERARVARPPEHSKLQTMPPSDRDGAHACLRVTDDGPGIAEADRARVFEPFFTTKDVGEGTGLGLAVAFGIVRENGGWITVESELGHGASFAMFFPCTAAA